MHETTDKNTAIERWKQDLADKNLAIDGRREAFWQDKDAICRVINEHSEVFDDICASICDHEKEIRKFIDSRFTAEAKEDLKL